MALTSTSVGGIPRHGVAMLYAGLHLPIRATWEEFTPIVRFGTVAATMHPGITWGTEDQWGPSKPFRGNGLVGWDRPPTPGPSG